MAAMIAALLLNGCRRDLTPTYAFDPIWLSPAEIDGQEGVTGFHTWQLYGPNWPKRYSDKHYACSVVVSLDGLPIECDAEECSIGWELTSEILESDCPAKKDSSDPLFLSLFRVGLGGEAKGPDVPWPGKTSVGWADYGSGWEIHGDAYPESLDSEGEGEGIAWDGEQPFVFVPTSAFPL